MKNLVLAALLAGGMMFGQTKKVINSNVEWWGYKLAKTEASSHNGVVNLKSGDVIMKGNNIVGGTFSLDMNSINATDLTGEYQTKLNNHLKNGDFFETDKFPQATYKITSVKKSNNKAFPYLVNGDLTAKGKTNPVSIPAKISLKNGVLNMVSDKFSFDRQKFGIAYASAAKDVVVKDEIDMVINITAK
ncbi:MULTISPECIES: YceI family protein [unclassified Kaistella]|uniref:YceI family protein n=1 Tax=unclassified Kaistella TaxID=2762626 RepID=UPI00273706F0|nr:MULTISPECIES: YceI family protein [unclassified Kaistella]MDP2454069.1 YceI family protein [Kaistella sp. SH11-4b]MDP2457126.1 YceI family protein [Kaistella sp. SH40-3]MDP2459884.1 YceI family protein [Kaistella sp. SH19-2b]